MLVLDKGPASARLALELTKVTPRVVFLTELDTLGLPEDLIHEIKRSDVKVDARVGGAFLVPAVEFRQTDGRMIFTHLAVDARRLGAA